MMRRWDPSSGMPDHRRCSGRDYSDNVPPMYSGTRANKLGAAFSRAAFSPTKSPAGNHTTVGSPSTRVGQRPRI